MLPDSVDGKAKPPPSPLLQIRNPWARFQRSKVIQCIKIKGGSVEGCWEGGGGVGGGGPFLVRKRSEFSRSGSYFGPNLGMERLTL